MAGLLTLNINLQPTTEDSITVRVKYLNSAGDFVFIDLPIYFVSRRSRETEATIGLTILDTTNNYVTAFNLDYRNRGGSDNLKAEVVYSPDSATLYAVKINLNNRNWLFEEVIGGTQFTEYSIENEEIKTVKEANFTGYNTEDSDCDNLAATFELKGGSELYNAYIEGGKVVSETASPLTINLNRAKNYSIRFTDSLGEDIQTLNLKTPRKIIPEDISASIVYTDSGGSVNVDVGFISNYILPLSYSMDGVNFVTQNVFTGQPNGDYTIYVKDAFGCVTQKNITVDGVSTVTETTFEISDINPIRYSKVESGKKNRYNTLSHEQLKNVAYPFIQHFTDKDSPITQIKTNAKHLSVFAMDCDGGTTTLNPVKRSNHIGQELKTTGTKFSTEDNRLGIYFGVADVLDPLSDDIIETKDYGYQVPYGFNKIGRFVTVEGLGTVPVDSIAYDDSYEAFVLLFNISFTGEETPTTVRATYNIQNYEIYEFVADISNLPDKFNILIEAGQSATDVKYTYLSERIQKTVDSDKLTEIIYWNTTNLGSMNYATGVVHTLRLHNVLSRLADEQTVDGYNGDTERYNTNHEIFDGEEFIFAYLSEEMVRKMRTILAHDMLFINGVHYRLGDVPELTSRFTTNICELTAVLRKGGDQTENFDTEIIEPYTGEGVDQATYELEQAIAAAKGKALILWKK